MGSARAIRISRREILFENQSYLAVAKRSGWAVAPSPRGAPSVTDSVAAFLRNRAGGGEPYLALKYAPETASSGVVLYATTLQGDRDLPGPRPSIERVLHAVCVGRPPVDSAVLQDYLRKKRVGRRERLVKVNAGGKQAALRYRVLERRDGLVHLELDAIAGPSEHVRAQLAAAGLPILGDRVYGHADPAVEGMLLHTRRLTFVDGLSGADVTVEAPLPEGFLAPRAGETPAALRYVLFYKPYGVLSQFTVTDDADRCLGDYDLPAGVYPVGRLDKDSEGLLLLTDDGRANARLSDPTYGKEKAYWVQVERMPTDGALAELEAGVVIRGYRTRPCRVRRLTPPPDLPERDPPIRFRKDIPTGWLEIILTEGKNRQVRRMTAAIGHPTLRLVRARVDRFSLGDLRPGEFAEVDSF